MNQRTITADRLADKLVRAYPSIEIIETSEGKVLINAEEPPSDKDDYRIFDYYSTDWQEQRYIMGVRIHLHNFLERNGWYAQWVNHYTMALYKA